MNQFTEEAIAMDRMSAAFLMATVGGFLLLIAALASVLLEKIG